MIYLSWNMAGLEIQIQKPRYVGLELSSDTKDHELKNLRDVTEGLMKACGENIKECDIADGIVIKKTNYKILPYVVEMHTAKSNLRVFISENGDLYSNSRLDDLTFKVNRQTMSVLETKEVQSLDFEGEFYTSEIFKNVPESLEDGIIINVPKGPQEEIQRLSFKKVDPDQSQYRELQNTILRIASLNSSTKN